MYLQIIFIYCFNVYAFQTLSVINLKAIIFLYYFYIIFFHILCTFIVFEHYNIVSGYNVEEDIGADCTWYTKNSFMCIHFEYSN